jgi:hypothetical protein
MPARAAFAAAAFMSLALFPADAQAAPANPYDGDWHFTLTPYAWIPAATADLNFVNPVNGANASVHSSAGDILSNLKFALMGTGDVRNGEWTAFADIIYADLGSSKAKVKTITGPNGLLEIPIDVDTKASLQEVDLTLGVGRSIYHDGGSFADGFAGVRYAAIKSALDFSFAGPLNLFPISGRLRNSTHTWDALVGVKGRYAFESSPWFILYYGDVGTGRSNLTGQVYAGPGYAFDWGDMFLTFRYLHYDIGAHARLINQLDIYGPAIGATFYL